MSPRFQINRNWRIWQPPFIYRGVRGQTEAVEAAPAEDPFEPKVLGINKWGQEPCDLAREGINVLLNMTKKVEGEQVRYIRFLSSKTRSVRVKYLPHHQAYCAHPADVGVGGADFEMRQSEWGLFVNGLSGEEKKRAEQGWTDYEFVWAVFPQGSQSYFTSLRLVGLRHYPPFREYSAFVRAWKAASAEKERRRII